MNILIISPYYVPNINPRPYRWSRIAEKFVAEGHEVTVLCEKQTGYQNQEKINGVLVRRTGYASLKSFFLKNKRGVLGAQKGRKQEKFANWINRVFVKSLYFPDDSFVWYFGALKVAKEIVARGKTDVVISSALPFTSHLIGLKLKKKYSEIFWIADSGDPFSLQTEAPLNNHFLYGKLNRWFEQQVLDRADKITVTSERTRNKYAEFSPKVFDKMHVIPPMLSPPESSDSDEVEFLDAFAGGQKIRLGYFGKFYQTIRPSSVLTDFLEKLFLEKPEMAKQLEVHIFGDVFPEFIGDLERIPAIKVHGLVPRAQVAELMQKMDVLVNVSNTTDYQLPSKAPDYLNSGKAILNIYSKERDEFKHFFDQYPAIYNYQTGDIIDHQLLDFIQNASSMLVNREWIEKESARFSVDNIAKAYENLFRFVRK